MITFLLTTKNDIVDIIYLISFKLHGDSNMHMNHILHTNEEKATFEIEYSSDCMMSLNVLSVHRVHQFIEY